MKEACFRPPVVVIGIGNEFRQDDGAGRRVAADLRALGVPASVEVLELSGEGAGLIEAWDGRSRAIVIDAVRSGAPPGTIHRFDAARLPLPRGLFRCSSHLFGPAEAVATAGVLGRLPAELAFYGIEGADFGYGELLTAPVAEAVTALAVQLASVLKDCP